MRVIFVILLISFSLMSEAKDCNYVPKATLCDVSIREPSESFIKVLGEPSIELKLGGERRAIAYSRSNNKSSKVFMLIFSGNLLAEVRAWETNPNIDFWVQVPQLEEVNLIIGGVNFIGRPRGDDNQLDKKFKLIGADGFGQGIEYMGANINLTYLPFYGPSTYKTTDFTDYRKNTCHSITIKNVNGIL